MSGGIKLRTLSWANSFEVNAPKLECGARAVRASSLNTVQLSAHDTTYCGFAFRHIQHVVNMSYLNSIASSLQF